MKGSISLLITGDEEGPAINGTAKLLAWLKARGEKSIIAWWASPPAWPAGDTLKIGRRGSINFKVTVTGVQGHVGYPQKAKNPIPVLAELVTQLASHKLDKGNDHFDPSTLAFTTVDVGNDATNVIPGEARAAFNIRFNDRHTPDSLINWVADRSQRIAKESGCAIDVTQQSAVCPSSPSRANSPSWSATPWPASPASRRFFPPAAARRMPASSRISARWWNWGWPAPPCTRPMNAWRWPRSALTDIYAALLTAYFENPPR